MLTDIFAERYKDRTIWNSVGSVEIGLLTQCFRIIAEQVMPITFENGEVWQEHLHLWKNAERNLSMELGIDCLEPESSRNPPWKSLGALAPGLYDETSVDQACRSFMRAPFQADWPGFEKADSHMKVRISFVELAFREKQNLLFRLRADSEKSIARIIAQLISARTSSNISSDPTPIDMHVSAVRQERNIDEAAYADYVAEINERFRRAGAPLNLHNGFIQITTDPLLEAQIATPFWALVADPKWVNVDIDMKEAVDRRESGERDPSFYAAKALESVIKIISSSRGWTSGNERGAINYIENLQSKAHGNFIAAWEAEALKFIFARVRNDLSHGPGEAPMPSLSPQQTNWVIESAMSWTKSLIERMQDIEA